MSGYEVEHGIKASQTSGPPPRRPDLSTFFSTLEHVDTSGERRPQNVHSQPFPDDVSAVFRQLAEAFSMMQGGHGGTEDNSTNELLESLVQSLMENAEHPPKEVEGVPDSFLAELDRVPKKSLKKDDSCPICSNPFLDDPHPLVVRLPCHKDHIFDLDCITPWLKLNPTCPMDRQMLLKKKEPPPPPDEDDGEYDDMYA